jgi:hypothetical protein
MLPFPPWMAYTFCQYIMKPLALLLIAIAGLQVGCTNDEAKIVVDVYSPDKSTGSTPGGTFDSSPLDLYLDGEYVGTTPVIFRQSDLVRLNLPDSEWIQESPTQGWYTWDLGRTNGTLSIAHKHDKQNKRTLEFRSRDKKNPVPIAFSGFSRSQREDGTLQIYARFPKAPEAEQAVPPNGP